MNSSNSPRPELQPRDDWNPALPRSIPKPTAWPAGLALGSTLLVWGLVSSLLLSLAGALVFIVCMIGWIGEIRHERQ